MRRKPACEHIKHRASAVGEHVTDDGVRAIKARQAGDRGIQVAHKGVGFDACASLNPRSDTLKTAVATAQGT